ncbi:MAG: hypothetical protein ACREFE_05570 [Limisphaerales bacterium]
MPRTTAAAGSENRLQEFQTLAKNPSLKSLGFKKIKSDLWSVRAGSGFRALGTFEDGRYLWFWIGTHDEYERIIRDL